MSGFECGEGSLDQWLERHATAAAGAGSARTYVTSDSRQGRVVGYHALTVASIEHEAATDRAKAGMPRHEIPAILLARLAVDVSVQGQGLGAFLLSDALRRAIAVSEEAGVRIMLVHALNQRASTFYRRFGFEESPTDRMNLQMIIKDVRVSLEDAARG